MFQNKFITEDRCPFCEGEGLHEGSIQVDGPDMWVHAECPHCHADWQDVYEQTFQEYMCPACGSGEFESCGGLECDGPHGYVEMECLECGETWLETYEYAYSEGEED